MREGGQHVAMCMLFTLLPYLGKIVYDGTIVGRPLPPSVTEHDLAVLIDAAIAAGEVVSALPEPPEEPPFVGKRVVVLGLRARPELNGQVALALAFLDDKQRYEVELPGGGHLALRAANLTLATAAQAKAAEKAAWGGDENLRKRIVEKLCQISEKEGQAASWTVRRMAYTEAENPAHEMVIIAGDGRPIFATKSNPADSVKATP
eukprot:scaffold1937_cov120-Isochrysis_galbana.AAC.2